MNGPAPKPTILDIEPYKPGNAKAAGFERPIKLSANENPLGCSPAAREAYARTAQTLHRYPDPRAEALRQALAQKYDLDPACIIFGTGSDELFSMACQAYLSPGETMVQPQFAFAAWAIAARAAGANVKSAPERDFHVDVDAMLAAVDETTRVVFIANPANPTGTRIPLSEIVRLHKGLRPDTLLVLDGAYAEFCDDGGLEEWALFKNAPNVLITRTFSKLHGLASLRIGWGYAAPEIIDALNRIRLPFNLSTGAQAAALAALADEDFVRRSVAQTNAGRARLNALAERFGWAALPSAANFVTVRIPPSPRNAAALESALVAKGVLVRRLSPYHMPDCIRISVGTDQELDRLEEALHAILG